MKKTEANQFYALDPFAILDAVEGVLLQKENAVRLSGRALALNSLENRVYDLELEDDSHIVTKFYRPGRWTQAQIQEEHDFLFALEKAEIPVIAPLRFNEKSLFEWQGIFFAIFPKVKGRLSDELSDSQLQTLGRYIARIHAVGASFPAKHRVKLEPVRFLEESVDFLLENQWIDLTYEKSYQTICQKIADKTKAALKNCSYQLVHGDCHLGNTLWQGESPFFLDFDDSLLAPPLQDIWMVISGREEESLRRREILLAAYESMRPFPRETLKHLELLRAMRLVHYSAWVARRWQDPSFPKHFPDFGSARYWQEEIRALEECLRLS